MEGGGGAGTSPHVRGWRGRGWNKPSGEGVGGGGGWNKPSGEGVGGGMCIKQKSSVNRMALCGSTAQQQSFHVDGMGGGGGGGGAGGPIC